MSNQRRDEFPRIKGSLFPCTDSLFRNLLHQDRRKFVEEFVLVLMMRRKPITKSTCVQKDGYINVLQVCPLNEAGRQLSSFKLIETNLNLQV